MSNNQTHKQLKSPDELQVKLVKLMDWILSHKMKILGGALVVAAAWLTVIAYGYWQHSKSSELNTELSLIDVQFDKEMEVVEKQQTEIAKSIAELDNKLNAKPVAPVNTKPQDPKKPDSKAAATLSDQDKALLVGQKAALELKKDALKADHGESLKRYQAFFDNHQNAKEGWVAGLKAASILAQQKKMKEAVDLVSSLVKRSQGNEYFQIQGRLNLIGLLEDSGDFKAALPYADELMTIADKEFIPQVLLTKARLQYLAKDKESARKAIDQLLKDHATSVEARQAKTFKALLY